MNVLSLFDGMSCARIALRELGIKIDRYYASEINKHAIKQTQLNFPDTIQLGDVRDVHAKDLPKIDLICAGSPCQDLSFAGKMKGLDGERSGLFFEFIRILNECREINPDVKFLLENVRMKREYEQVISDTLGLKPVMINSALVSAQNRVRLYWSNIRTAPDGLFEIKTDIPQPKDRGLFLRDILEDNAWEHNDLIVKREVKQINPCTESGGKQPYQQNRVYDADGIMPSLCSAHAGHAPLVACDEIVRRITPTEAARLQTIPDWYKWECSATQQYTMLGNGWCIEVIKHILSYLYHE